jgi:hypothetical protein
MLLLGKSPQLHLRLVVASHWGRYWVRPLGSLLEVLFRPLERPLLLCLLRRLLHHHSSCCKPTRCVARVWPQ